VDAGAFVGELLERAEGERWGGGDSEREGALHEVLDMMACKAAVKAGDSLSETEVGELLSLRERVERASNCPHGRPTSIRMTIRELDRRFGRG
jgi:DNA mismatch repair protein MutL